MLITLVMPSMLIAKELKCTKDVSKYWYGPTPQASKFCEINNQAVDSSDYTIASSSNDLAIEAFHIHDSKNVKFIPHNIGPRFPRLIFLLVWNCAVKGVEAKHFEKMPKLRVLDLAGNEIDNIPSDAFTSLRNLENLYLQRNQLKNLHEKLFGSLHKLILLHLEGNKITALSTKLFDGKKNLREVDLRSNRCADTNFVFNVPHGPEAFTGIRKVLAEKCDLTAVPEVLGSKPEALMITAFSLVLASLLFLFSFVIQKYLKVKPE